MELAKLLNEPSKTILPSFSQMFGDVNQKKIESKGIIKKVGFGLGRTVYVKIPAINIKGQYKLLPRKTWTISTRVAPKNALTTLNVIKSMNRLIDKHDGYLCCDYGLRITDQKVLSKTNEVKFECFGKLVGFVARRQTSLNVVVKSMSKLHGFKNINTKPNSLKIQKTFHLVIEINGLTFKSKGFLIYSSRMISQIRKDLKAKGVSRKKRLRLTPKKFEDGCILYSKL